MFENALTVAKQVVTLYLLIAVGFGAYKAKLIDGTGAKQMTNLLLIIVTPCLMIDAFQIEFNPALIKNLAISAAVALFAHLIAAVIGWLFFRKEPAGVRRVLRFAVIFSNCGFMCLPLLRAVLGDEGVLYGTVYLAVFNIMLWTLGVVIISGDKRQISAKRALLNPGVIGFLIAMPVFLFSIQLPSVAGDAVTSIASLNTPIAMVVIGCHIAEANLKGVLRDKKLYLVSSLRLILIPLLVFSVMLPFHLPQPLFVAAVISASAPVAAGTVLFSSRFGQDTVLASRAVTVSTLFSILTMPLLILLANSIYA